MVIPESNVAPTGPTTRLITTVAFTGALIAYLLWADFTRFGSGSWHLHHTLGLSIVIPSFVLWTAGRWQLGSSFTPRAEARWLVTHGLYSRIRHPIYVFAECIIAGILTFIGYPVLWLVSALLIPWQIARARAEERVLEDTFGDAYRAYRDMT